ncbi:hypothetical protein C8R43DRAFT_940482 [Mycena crocata]|nr:hypothetical protein C8R43DRAFT_940482 [Mycena crocata]
MKRLWTGICAIHMSFSRSGGKEGAVGKTGEETSSSIHLFPVMRLVWFDSVFATNTFLGGKFNVAQTIFPPFPAPLKWATRWWFARKHSEAWQFGPLDLYGRPRVNGSG